MRKNEKRHGLKKCILSAGSRIPYFIYCNISENIFCSESLLPVPCSKYLLIAFHARWLFLLELSQNMHFFFESFFNFCFFFHDPLTNFPFLQLFENLLFAILWCNSYFTSNTVVKFAFYLWYSEEIYVLLVASWQNSCFCLLYFVEIHVSPTTFCKIWVFSMALWENAHLYSWFFHEFCLI